MKDKFEIQIEYSKGKGIREKLMLWLLEVGAPFHYRFNPARQAWGLDSNSLLKFPENSLGKTLGQFYKIHRFEPIAKGERHDVFHVLFNYSTSVPDEAAMQFFLWGNGKGSVFTIGTAIISGFMFPTLCPRFIKEYHFGKSCTNISGWDFKSLLPCNINELRNKILNNQSL